KSMWLGGRYTEVTPDMTQEVSSAFNRQQLWDDTTDATRTGLRRSWESLAGFAPLPNTFTEGNYGQYLHDGRLVTDRFSALARAELSKRFALDYHGDYFRHYTADAVDRTRRGEGHGVFSAAQGDVQLEYKDEWRVFPGATNQGMAGAGLSAHATAIGLKESLFYSQFRSGNGGLLHARDTGFSVQWDQELTKTFSSAWNSALTGHYFLRSNFNRSSETTVLITAQNDVSAPTKGLTTHQTYQVTIEQASAMVQIPVPVGKGLGDHAWNDTLKEYVPAKNGDYIIQEQEIYGNASDNRVRKAHLNTTWSLTHPKKRGRGILTDLGWSGTLNVEEQLAMGRLPGALSWIPGYTSLFTRNALIDSLVQFADMYYRQNMDWNPDSLRAWRGQLYVQPLLKKIRDYSEKGWQWGGSLVHTIRLWDITLSGDVLSIHRQSDLLSSLDNFDVIDRHAQLCEKYAFYRDFSSYLKEAAGWSSKSSDPLSHGWYFYLMPGIMWEPGARGSADVSYTYSSVDIPGILDYRMAQGFASGISHTIDLTAHLNFGAHFMTDLTYRSQFGSNVSSKGGLHTVSMQMKALL
ncbi:MAG TPA: hypothetical protein VF335_01305, partial [Chitinivibrionales bacterium]